MEDSDFVIDFGLKRGLKGEKWRRWNMNRDDKNVCVRENL